MTHRTPYIDTTPREDEIILSATSFTLVVKLGRGNEHRETFGTLPEATAAAPLHGRGAMIYANGTASGVAVSALCATLAGGKWKFVRAVERLVLMGAA